MLVAINKQFKNRPDDSDFGQLTRTFENVDISLLELATDVQRGHPFCAQHRNNHKKSANFTASGMLAVDVDHGLNIATALAHPFVQQFGGFLYTTLSHTQDEQRFRIVFELEQPITDGARMEQALNGLILKLGGDPACKDACRMFYGNTSAEVTMLGRTLPTSEVDLLVIRAKEVASSDESTPSSLHLKATVRSQLLLDQNVMVRDRHGKSHRLVSLPALTPIYCPVHVDNNPSAFTIRSKKGTPGVHCKACIATFFIRHEGPYYDFDYNLERIRSQNFQEIEQVKISDDPVVGPITQELHTGVGFVRSRYLNSINTSADVILIKSPKGSGKTEWLKGIVDDAKNRKQSVLLIGHRQNLIIATAKRLGLTSYIRVSHHPETGRSVLEATEPTRHYAVCVDSLAKLDATRQKYDIVIIDEVEQVTAHLTADTLRDRRRDALLYLQFYLRKATKIYCLDADLNRVSVSAIADIVGGEPRRNALLVANDWAEKRGVVHLYRSQSHLVQVVRDHLSLGRRCFVCSNSKNLVKELKSSLEELFSAEKRFFLITSDESKSVEAQEFLNALPASMLQYDCVLVSPAVGTGVDITFPNAEAKVDSVFGFFRSRVTTHFDIDQQLCRVRNPGEVHVWIEPSVFNFETDPEVLRHEYLQAMRRDLGVIGLSDDGTPTYPEIDTIYASIYADVKALQRASKNNLVQNFQDLRAATGWDIVSVEPEEQSKELGKEILERGKELERQASVKLVCEAPQISSDEYSSLRAAEDTKTLHPIEQAAMRRYELEHFYFLPVTEELIELDNGRKFRDSVRLFDTLMTGEHEVRLAGFPQNAHGSPRFASDRDELVHKRKLLVDLFTAAGVFQEGKGFNTQSVVTQETLAAFAATCRQRRVSVERLLDRTIRSDLDTKAAQQLGDLLKLVGLSTTRKATKKDGKKTYRYQINDEDLVLVEAVAQRRKSLSSAQPTAETSASENSPSQLQELVAVAVANTREKKKQKATSDALVSYDATPDGSGDTAVSTAEVDRTPEGVAVN